MDFLIIGDLGWIPLSCNNLVKYSILAFPLDIHILFHSQGSMQITVKPSLATERKSLYGTGSNFLVLVVYNFSSLSKTAICSKFLGAFLILEDFKAAKSSSSSVMGTNCCLSLSKTSSKFILDHNGLLTLALTQSGFPPQTSIKVFVRSGSIFLKRWI